MDTNPRHTKFLPSESEMIKQLEAAGIEIVVKKYAISPEWHMNDSDECMSPGMKEVSIETAYKRLKLLQGFRETCLH
jgi:hypothetical protein